MRPATAVHAALFALLLFLLGLPAAATTQAQGISGSRTLTLEAGERGAQYYFAPDNITVPAGQVTVTLNNSGARPHNFTIEDLNLRIPDVAAGKSAEATLNFTTPGTYPFICDLPGHAARGAKGVITVVAAAAAPAPVQQATTASGVSATPGGSTAAGTAAQATRPATSPAVSSAPATTSTATSATARNLPLFISLAIHIPSAITWLGIALYDLIVVAVPFLSPAQRGGLLHRPRWLAAALIPLILVTGIYQTINNPFSTLTDFNSLEALRTQTTYGFALFLKHGFVLASLALTLILSFWVAPRLAATTDDGPSMVATSAGGGTLSGVAAITADRRLPVLVAWANALACLALILCVTVMVFQLH